MVEVGFGPVEGGLQPGGEIEGEMEDAAVDGFEGEFGRLQKSGVIEDLQFVDAVSVTDPWRFGGLKGCSDKFGATLFRLQSARPGALCRLPGRNGFRTSQGPRRS